MVRTLQNWIGGSSYNPCSAAFVPPPPQTLDALVHDLLADVNGDDHAALVPAAIAHAQFETLHPFADGNGRTGRALIHVILRRRERYRVFESADVVDLFTGLERALASPTGDTANAAPTRRVPRRVQTAGDKI